MTTESTHGTAIEQTKEKLKKTSKGKVVTREVTDAQFRYFEKYVTNITLDLLEYKSSMSKFEFKVLDTMGCLETVILTSDSVCCSSLACRQKCQHMIWLFYHIFGFKKRGTTYLQKEIYIPRMDQLGERVS